MKKRISRARMRQLMNELRELAKSAGFTLKVYYRPVNWNYGGSGCPLFGTSGQCMVAEKKLIIRTSGRPARRDLLKVIAHEVRHAIHVKDGLFKDYYRDADFKQLLEYARGRAPKPNVMLPNLIIAWFAELDCDAWAAEWLESREIENPEDRVYPFYGTLAYRIKEGVEDRDRS